MNRQTRGRIFGSRGSSLVEFTLVAVQLFFLLFSAVEFGRMILVYTTLANAARIGLRYAIVHGSNRSDGSGIDGASGPGNDPANVVDVIKDYAKIGLLDTSRIRTPMVTYVDSLNSPGSRVRVTVVYPYDPFFSFLPLTVNIGSTAEGVIAY